MRDGGLEVLFIGGLGNQLFQFALGEALHARTGTEVRYRTAAFPDRNGRTLGIPGTAFRPGSLSDDTGDADGSAGRRPPWGLLPLAMTSPRIPAGARRALGDVLLRSRSCYIERDLDFDAGVLDVRPPAHLIGFWQSWRYVGQDSEVFLQGLRAHLHPVGGPEGRAGTVAVHVRLGDRRNRAEAAFHHPLSRAYYQSAIELLRERHGHLTLVLFSDDVPAARSLLGDQEHLVVGEDQRADPWGVLSRMANCDHHVIANSTLSWWAARLATEPAGDVVAPRRWFRARGISPEDRYPPGWTVI